MSVRIKDLRLLLLTIIVSFVFIKKAFAASANENSTIRNSTSVTNDATTQATSSSIFDNVASNSNLKYFEPLECNDNIENETCLNFTDQNYDLSQTVVIPCGTCIIMDTDAPTTELYFWNGLDIHGKLVFPSSLNQNKLKITTPFVFVQGMLTIEPQLLEIHFVGIHDNVFTAHPDQKSLMCLNGCTVSKKSFVVGGGTVNIDGMDSDKCPFTWTNVQSAIDAGPASMNEPLPPPVATTVVCDKIVVNELFNDSILLQKWDGVGAGIAQQIMLETNDGYYTVSDRTSSTQGPRVFFKPDCLIPNVHYLLRFQYRYRHSDSTTTTTFGAPYVKMTRKRVTDGGTDWMNINAVYQRGSISKVQVDQWYDYQMVISFTDDMVNPSSTVELAIYIAPFNAVVETIDVDNFVLERPSDLYEDAMYTRSCHDLLLNGDSDLSNVHVYPFYPTGGTLQLITTTDTDDGTYFRSSLRTSTWQSILSQDIPTQCLVKAAIYEFKAHVKVFSIQEKKVLFDLNIGSSIYHIVTCPPSSNNQWVVCTAKIQLTKQHEQEAASSSNSARLYTRVLNDDTSAVDVTNLSFQYQGGRTIQLVVSSSSDVLSSHCWTLGSEILITSHTIQQDDTQVAIIQSINETTITLVDPIHEPITLDNDVNTGVEIALLTRQVKFTVAQDDDLNPLEGGHFIIMHTTAPVIQKLIGIEIDGFGQQGTLGRYPIHFHMCGNVTGSVVSKNTIRNSKQRGIVVHGTNDLYVSENILYNIRGHAVMLEDGGERWNIFERNLGAVGHGVDKLISNDESDHTPSTFWITNPQNTWIGNVAAGSQFSGFWFEVKTKVRGSSASIYPDMVPNKLDLLKFIDNVSHSNSQGLQTYPQAGYRPNSLAVFENHKSFRNRIAGIFFHAGGRLSIDGGYISDNKIGVDIDMDHSDVISNTVVVGSSLAYKEVVDSMGYEASQWPATALCNGGDNDSLVGIRLDSYHDGSLFGATGSSLENVDFSGFGFGSCEGSSSLHVDGHDIRYFDTRNKLKNIHVADDSVKINLCDSEMQVAIYDADGSFVGEGNSGFIISNTNAIRSHPDCISLDSDSCASFCPGICLRTMSLLVPSFYERNALTLEITGTIDDGRSITPVFIQDFRTKEILRPQQESSHRILYATLPASGKYYGQFFWNGQPIWPLYTDLKYEDDVGNCGPDFASFDIEKLSPLQCAQLIQNGNFESGNSDYWWHLGSLGLELIDSEGADGTNKSLLAPNAANNGGGKHVGVGQYLDTRCIREGQTITFTAKVKLRNSVIGSKFECNLDGYSSDSLSCPRASLRFTNRLEGPTHAWRNLGTMVENDKEWNLMSGSYLITAYDKAAHSAFLYINGAPSNVDLQIDEISLTNRCIDSTLWKYKGKKKYNCGWVRSNRKKRCKKKGEDGVKAKIACPIACQNFINCIKPSCKYNSEWNVIVKGKTKNCKYLKKKSKSRCGYIGFDETFGYEACKVCGDCNEN